MSRARLDRVDNDARMALSRAGSGSTLARALEYTFVYRPGAVGPLAPNVFATWPAAMAAMAMVAGPKLLSVDDSLVTPALVPPGVWDLEQVTLAQARNGATLQFEDGATITARLMVVTGLTIVHDNATTPVWTWDATAPLLLMLDSAGVFASGPGVAPFIENPAALGTNGALSLDGGVFGDGVTPSISTGAGTTTDVTVEDGGAFATNAAAGAGAYVIVNTSDGAVGAQPAVAVTMIYFQPPDTISEHNLVGIGPAAPLTFTSAGTITRKKSGKVRVGGAMQVTGAVGTVTFTLLRDGATVLATQTIVADAGGTAQCSLPWIDTLPDLAAHHYSIRAADGATALSSPGGGAIITADELS